MKRWKDHIKEYLVKNADHTRTLFWYDLMIFFETTIFPIPPDFWQIALTLSKPKRWKLFFIHSLVASVLGGVFAYGVGFWLFDSYGLKIVSIFNLGKELESLVSFFQYATFWSVLVAAFTPVPYRVFTISAGLFHANIFLFVVASIIGRGCRFLIVGFVTSYFGNKYADKIFRHFNIFALAIGILAFIFLVVRYFPF